MNSNGELWTDREKSKLERKIFNEFVKRNDLSKFDKETLRKWKVILNFNYGFYRGEFYNYLMDNQTSFNNFINKLDNESKEVVNLIIKDVEYINTHSFIELLQDILDKEEKIMDYLEVMKSFTHLKLHENVYEQSVFGYRHGLVYLPEDILKFLNNKDFLDCGAYIGDSALIFEKYYNPRKVYSFEPDDENYNLLLNTMKLNDLKKVKPIKLGVGSYDNFANFFHSTGASHITDENSETQIKITSIDKFVFDNNIDVGLIKIDVEGYELEVLEGAKRTIKEFKPVLSISIYHNAEQFIHTMDFIQDLVPDYKCIIRHLEDILRVSETLLIVWINND